MRSVVGSILAALAVVGVGHAADVHVGINIGVPPPPALYIPAPPRLVVVPATPVVQYAPDLSVNFFAYGGSYYTFNDGAWFVASAYDGPWTYVDYARVPRPVRIVPYRYYRIPPGHAKRYYYHGHPHGMPPGQAKKIYGYGKHGYDGRRFAEESHGHGHGHGHDHRRD